MSPVLRLILTALGTMWVTGVMVAWVMLPTWLGVDADGHASGWGGYWAFGWILAAILAAVPFFIYSNIDMQTTRR